MAEGGDKKERLGRLRLERRAILSSRAGLRASTAVAESDASRPPRLHTSKPAEETVPAQLASALVSDERGIWSVDLRRVHIALDALACVPRQLAQERVILPLHVDDERLYVAVGEASEPSIAEELGLASGREVRVYVALHGMLRDVIEQAYAARHAGAVIYTGPLAALEERADAARTEAASVGDRTLGRQLSEPPIAMPESAWSPGQTVVNDPSARRVLVIDRDPHSLELLSCALKDAGYEVIQSGSGAEALQKVREFAPDVLVLDPQLSELHGFELCRRVKASRRYGHVRLVMVSGEYRGWRFAEDLKRSYGVDELVEKPVQSERLLAAVQRVLDGRAGQPIALSPPSGPAGALLQRGIDAYSAGEIARAVEHLKQGVATAPRSFHLHYHLGLLYGKQDNVFEAIQTLETAIDLQPHDFSTLKNLAVLYQRAGFRLKATEMWERALENAPNEATRTSLRNHLVSLL
jgi:DNA-binding response OmpR family regulator